MAWGCPAIIQKLDFRKGKIMISIRKIQEDDYPLTLELLKENENMPKYNYLEIMQDSLQHRLKNFFHDFFILTDEENNTIGVVYSYDFRVNDLNSRMNISFVCGVDDKIKTEAINCFVNYMFEEYPLKKIIFECIHQEDVLIFEKSGFYVEVTLKDYVYYSGRYMTNYILSKER